MPFSAVFRMWVCQVRIGSWRRTLALVGDSCLLAHSDKDGSNHAVCAKPSLGSLAPKRMVIVVCF